MPKDNIDYSNTIIYKIFCNNQDIKDIYIGHTTNFVKRKYQHKILCNNGSGKQFKIYDIIRDNGGWDNWTMVEIAKYKCKDATEARIREQEHYDLLKPNLNTINPISNNPYVAKTIDETYPDVSSSSFEQKYKCEMCSFFTNKISDFNRHLDTTKHNNLLNQNKKQNDSVKFKCICGKKYNHKSSLCKHKKYCEKVLHVNTSEVQQYDPQKTDMNELIVTIMKQMMTEQQCFMKDMVTEIIKNGITNTTNNVNNHNNSHNKTFNLQFFLNETCKNAMNLTDFVDSIKLQLSDLIKIGEVGYVEGISNIITTNLQALDITERPIHCADKKREVVYIKDEDKWEKEDDNKNKLRKLIKRVAYKNEKLLPQFKEKYPGYNTSESPHSDQYSKIVIEAMGGIGNDDKAKEDKIIRNISKVTTIDKEKLNLEIN